MGNAQRKRNDDVSIIPDDLRLFDVADIKKAFEYLEETFHLNRDWYKDFKQELSKIERGISEQEFFFRYVTKNIDPALQRLLRRKESVIFSLCRYLIKDKILEKKREQSVLQDYYRNDQWKNKPKPKG